MLLLRASGDHDGEEYDLGGVVGDGGDLEGIDVPAGDLLAQYVDAFYDSPEALRHAGQRLRESLGDGAFVDAAAVVGMYDSVVKVADATGIPIDESKVEVSEDVRELLGVNDFPSATEKI